MRSDHGGNDIALIPGEDIRIYAEAVTESGNTSASPVCQTNSLFQKVANGKIVVSKYPASGKSGQAGFGFPSGSK